MAPREVVTLTPNSTNNETPGEIWQTKKNDLKPTIQKEILVKPEMTS